VSDGPRHVFLDLDGTLTDPSIGIAACLRHAASTLGLTLPPDEDLTRYIGPPLEESFREILGTSDESTIVEAVRLYRGRFSTVGLFENRVYDGIPDALEAARSAGASLVLATAKPQVFAQRILEHFGLAPFFSGVHGPELSGARSDKSELLEYALSVEGADPARSVMVGDRRHDVVAAKCHGLPAIGVLWGFGSGAELSQAGADRLVDEVAALPGTLREVAARGL